MGKGVKSKQSERASGFAKEIFGMGLMLFSILSLLCLITGDVVFYTVGAYVQGFFLGLFGYFAFPVIGFVILLGLNCLIGHKVFSKKARRLIRLFCLLTFSVMAIIQTAAFYDRSLNFFSNFAAAYGKGLGTLKNSTPLGAISMLIINPIGFISSKVGCYIVFSLLIIFSLLLIFKKQVARIFSHTSDNARKANDEKNDKANKKSKSKKRQPFAPVEEFNQQLQSQPFENQQFQNHQPKNVQPDNDVMQQTPPRRPSFMENFGDFGMKTKRDFNKESKPIDVFGNGFGMRNQNQSNGRNGGTYQQKYRDDLSPEANYIITPPPLRPEDIGQPPIKANNPSNAFDRARTAAPNYDKSSMGGTVFDETSGRMNDLNNSRGNQNYSKDRPLSNERRGGLFDNFTDNRQGNSFSPNSGNRSNVGNDGYTRDIEDRLGVERGKRRQDDELSKAIDSFMKDGDTDLGLDDLPNSEKAYNPAEHVNTDGFNPNEVIRNRGYETRKPTYNRDGEFGREPFAKNAEESSRATTERMTNGKRDDVPNRTNVPDMNATETPFTNARTTDDFGRAPFAEQFTEDTARDAYRKDTFGERPVLGQDRQTDGTNTRTETTRVTNNKTTTNNQTSTRTNVYVSNENGRQGERGATEQPANRSNGGGLKKEDQSSVENGTFTSSTENELSKFTDETDPNAGYASIEEMPHNYKYSKPPIDLLTEIIVDQGKVLAERQRLMELAKLVEVNFAKRGITVYLDNIVYGMSITRFEYTIPTETSVKCFTQNQGDLAVWLHAKGEIRIVAPIPGTSKIGIEVPNNVSTAVGLKELLASPQFKRLKKDGIYIPAGKNVMAEPVFLNLTDMPHLLVAGATGTGKSVFLNAMLTSLLYTYSPEELRIVIVDPKQLEFVNFEGIPHLLFNKIITQAEEAAALLSYLVKEMDDRYKLFARERVKKISQYNEVIDKRTTKKLPYIIILIDEFADLMMKNATAKKDMDSSIQRLAQLARAAGISLVFATQRPTTDVIDGTIKNNFPARICFKTADYTNSQVVIGENGAEKLLGKGDLLYKTNGPTERAQGALVEDSEIVRIVSYVNENNDCYYDKNLLEYINKVAKTYGTTQSAEREGQMSMDLGETGSPADMPVVYRRAVRVVIVHNTTSKSTLQTKLGIGYNKAARIIDWMEKQGFISYVLDNKQREIRIDRAGYEQIFGEPFNEDYSK